MTEEQFKNWHSERVDLLSELIDDKEANYLYRGLKIEADTEKAEGLRLGLMMALEVISDCPVNDVSLTKSVSLADNQDPLGR